MPQKMEELDHVHGDNTETETNHRLPSSNLHRLLQTIKQGCERNNMASGMVYGKSYDEVRTNFQPAVWAFRFDMVLCV